MIDSITTVLPVDRAEPSIAFFAKVGLKATVEVPEGDGDGGDRIGFAILANDKAEVMVQTRTGIKADSGLLSGDSDGVPVMLFLQVPDIQAVITALDREPGGHIVTFAQFKPEE